MARKIYKSGRKNPNAYPKGKNHFYKKLSIIVAILIIAVSLIFTCLENLDITDWDEISGKLNVVDGVKTTDSDFTAYFLDADQSDCTIIVCGGQTLVIDAATANQFENIEANLKALGIENIDYMVITHPHDDHMGSAAEIINMHKVSNIIMPRLSNLNMVTTLAYEELLNTIADRGVNAIAAEPDTEFKVGNAIVQILAPLKQDKNLNNMSVVLRIIHGENVFLFMGDAEKKVENALMSGDCDLAADILKAGHHGSNTSSSDKFLKAVSPYAAVISCGEGNRYGHPHPDTIAALQNNNIDTLITMMTGDITVESNGKKPIKVTFEKSDEVKAYGKQ